MKKTDCRKLAKAIADRIMTPENSPASERAWRIALMTKKPNQAEFSTVGRCYDNVVAVITDLLEDTAFTVGVKR